MKKRVIIWGYGYYFEYVLSNLENNCRLVAIVDGDVSKQGKHFNDILIIGPQDLVGYEYDWIIVSVKNYNVIENEINKLDIPSSKVIYFWQDVYSDVVTNRIQASLTYRQELVKYRARWDSALYEFGQRVVPNILSAEELLNKVIADNCSLSRVGDGEFEMIFGNERPWFQNANADLGERIKHILQSHKKNVIIAVAQNFTGLINYKEEAADAIRMYMEGEKREQIITLLGDKTYYDAYVSRPYIIYKNIENANKLFELWRKVWENRDVLLVEGKWGRTGIANDLFSTARNIRRVVCPAKNAWDKYDEILTKILELAKEDSLICISLGPTATVLAYDLANAGYQALDIGQIDNEYDWFCMKTPTRVSIPGKMTAEYSGDFMRDEQIELVFESQVIARI